MLQETVRRVVVDVVVTHSQGKPVDGLGADDFRVFEDGKPQTIRHFDAYNPATAEALPARPSALPLVTFLNLPATSQKLEAPLTVILFDALNTPLRQQMYARQQMVKFLSTMPSGMPSAIFVLSDRLHLLQGFSGEREVLLQAATRQNPLPDQTGLLPTVPADNMALGSSTAQKAQPSPAAAGAPSAGQCAGTGSGSSPTSGGMAALSQPLSASALLEQMAEEMRSDLLDQRVNLTLIGLSSSFPIQHRPESQRRSARVWCPALLLSAA